MEIFVTSFKNFLENLSTASMLPEGTQHPEGTSLSTVTKDSAKFTSSGLVELLQYASLYRRNICVRSISPCDSIHAVTSLCGSKPNSSALYDSPDSTSA